MIKVHKLDDVRIRKPEDVRPAAVALRDMATELFDCRVAVCHNIAVKPAILDHTGANLTTEVFGWTDGQNDRWWKTPRLALNSLLPTACRYESEPFWCNSEGFRTPHDNPLLRSLDLTDFEKRCMATAAIVAPIHLPFGHIGAVSFVPTDPDKRDLSAEFEAYGDMLGLYARTFIAGYQLVMAPAERLPVGTILSKREVECLRWAAIGKTDMEIGMIMSRSRATVRFHINNAAAKLNSVNRSQTVFKAAQLGYIGLDS